MEHVIGLELPYPPSENRYRRHVGHMVVLSSEGRRYRERVRAAALAAGFVPAATGGDPEGIVRVPCALHVELYPADRRRRDIDNPLKALLDSLTFARVWEDDSLVEYLTVKKCPPVEGNPFCFVRIAERAP